jgi:hypothetical protein
MSDDPSQKATTMTQTPKDVVPVDDLPTKYEMIIDVKTGRMVPLSRLQDPKWIASQAEAIADAYVKAPSKDEG